MYGEQWDGLYWSFLPWIYKDFVANTYTLCACLQMYTVWFTVKDVIKVTKLLMLYQC